MRSTSIGWLKLKSANPLDHPILQPNYLSTGTTCRHVAVCAVSHCSDRWLKCISSPRHWRVGVQGKCQTLARDLRSESLRCIPRPRSPARSARPNGRRHRRFHPAEGRQRLPPVLHLQDGLALWPHGGGRPQRPCPGCGAAACGRCLYHAQHRQRQPQRSHHHDGGEGRWHHQRSTRAGWPRGSRLPANKARHPEVKEWRKGD